MPKSLWLYLNSAIGKSLHLILNLALFTFRKSHQLFSVFDQNGALYLMM